MKQQRDNLKQESENFKKTLEECEEKHAEEIKKCRDLWEAQKEEEVEQKLSKKVKILIIKTSIK